jgi:methylase of polypeptide subunit release factors
LIGQDAPPAKVLALAPFETPVGSFPRVRKSTALYALGAFLKERNYRFVTVTPDTHRRVVKRWTSAVTLEDVFGWNLPFDARLLPPALFTQLRDAGLLDAINAGHISRARCASVGTDLFFHSRFPTDENQSVFFGPDTYRFCRLIRATPEISGVETICDIGCGSGVGGLIAARISRKTKRVVLVDINGEALEFATANAALMGNPIAEFVESDVFAAIDGKFDLIVSNPPYMVDALARQYRDGGGPLGLDLSIRILDESIPRLTPKGRLVLYTGVTIVGGRDPFRDVVVGAAERAGRHFQYEEIDPDVFGEELDAPAYADADRIAAIGAVIG